MTDWQYGCNDGSNDNAAGAICRTLGFMHGTHTPVTKKMTKSLEGEVNFGWTRFACKYDDTLIMSNHCTGMLYEEAMDDMGMRGKCFNFDMMAVRCFQNAEFNINFDVKAKKTKVMCNPTAAKKGNKIDLTPMMEMMKVQFLIDGEEIEVEDLSFKKRLGWVGKVDLRKKEFECLTCEIHMNEEVVASGDHCKNDQS